MADNYHTTGKCVTVHKAGAAINSGFAPKAGRHGPTLTVWRKMRDRCLNSNSGSWANYGGRGITICDRWSTFENFLADMGERPEGLSIDRIDNDGNYEPGNCRWATAKEQARNTRANVLYEYEGETLCVSEIAERSGVDRDLLSGRLGLGWSVERATTELVGEFGERTAQPYTRLEVAMRELARRREVLLASGLTVDEIANRVLRRHERAEAA